MFGQKGTQPAIFRPRNVEFGILESPFSQTKEYGILSFHFEFFWNPESRFQDA
jgi:hypothetical protein